MLCVYPTVLSYNMRDSPMNEARQSYEPTVGELVYQKQCRKPFRRSRMQCRAIRVVRGSSSSARWKTKDNDPSLFLSCCCLL